MRRVTEPSRALPGRKSVRGWIFALIGAVSALPVLAVAALSASSSGWSDRAAGVAAVLGAAAALLAMGSPRWARRNSVWLANWLLEADLPAPVERRGRTRWLNRLRTSAWLLVHTLLGAAVTAFGFLAVLVALMLPLVWLGGGDDYLALFGQDVEVAGGWRGLWTLPAALGLATLTCAVCAGSAALLRAAAPLFLGRSAMERLAAAEEPVAPAHRS